MNDVNQRFKTYRNASNRFVISAQKAYYIKKILIENRSNSKMIWQTINFLLIFQKLKNQVEITKLQTPNGIVTSPIAFAKTLNEFFINIGPQKETYKMLKLMQQQLLIWNYTQARLPFFSSNLTRN